MNDGSARSATMHWFLQAASGALLIILLAIHLIVNHWAAPQGLLTYGDVIRYYDIPGIAWMETGFLVVVTIHCLLGLHSILLDSNLHPGVTRFLTWFLFLAGATSISYRFWLIMVIRSLSAS